MNSLITRIYTVGVALVVGVAIALTINAEHTATLWQQQSAAQLRLVQQLALRPAAEPVKPGAAKAAAAPAPQMVAATQPSTHTS
jgi:hypothetical protein